MVNEIVDGIAVKLGEICPEVEVYREEIAQGFKEPCFFILPLRTAQRAEVGNRYQRTHSFDVHYFPSEPKKASEETHAVASALLMGLEYITAGGDLIRATRAEYEVHDGVLHFEVDYTVFVRRAEEKKPLMEVLKQEGRVKDGG